jgi:hypothetical protein
LICFVKKALHLEIDPSVAIQLQHHLPKQLLCLILPTEVLHLTQGVDVSPMTISKHPSVEQSTK